MFVQLKGKNIRGVLQCIYLKIKFEKNWNGWTDVKNISGSSWNEIFQSSWKILYISKVQKEKKKKNTQNVFDAYKVQQISFFFSFFFF